MPLLQISEPGSNSIPHNHNIAIGIDLGTTNSLVAVVKSGVPTVLSNNSHEQLIPSCVYYGLNDQTIVGSQALKFKTKDPTNTLTSIKRFLGMSLADINQHNFSYEFAKSDSLIEIITKQGIKNPITVSSDILKELHNIAKDSLGENPIGAVITVPAYFNESQRQATKLAANLANLKVMRLLNEPTAAAIAYGLDNKRDGIFLVYDLGGGTLDVSILKLNNGIFEVLAVSGNTSLGGDDFDQLIADHIKHKYNLANLSNIDNELILNMAKTAKESFSDSDIFNNTFRLSNGVTIDFSMTYQDFYTLSKQLVNEAIFPIHRAIRDAKISIDEINDIVMVGGSSRLLNIKEAITQIFKKPLLCSIDPDKVVAIGAAIQADILAGNNQQDVLLLDVTPLSLGIETFGGLVEKIIPRNSTIPITRSQEFTTSVDGQTKMSIHVVQGERELVTDCRSLAKFSLTNIPPMIAGHARIRVTFSIDADGLLSINATEESTKTSASIIVKPSFGLTDEQISMALKQSVESAKNDILNRQLIEVTNSANHLIKIVEKSISNNLAFIDKIEIEIINQRITQLKGAINSSTDIADKTTNIKYGIDQLNSVTEKFAKDLMDNAIKINLVNKQLEQLK